jgi:hypothetical protein
MPSGAIGPVRASAEIVRVAAVFDVGSSGAHTVKYGKGIASVAKVNTGEYKVTFTEVWPILLDLYVNYHLATGVESLVAHYEVDTFDAAAKTATFKVNEIDETAALVEPASGSDCYIEATFLKTV